ncbi:MAG: aminotransferase class I/II-fold pyridoxal phosphate-dependent enzyme, partial [Oscillospiraceae bacterium]
SVVASINIAIRAFSNEGDGIIIQTPVYDPFSSIVVNCNRKPVINQLIVKNNRYEMNFEELENLVKQKENKVMVLCSPHNPVGRVWTKDELIRVADLCMANNVILISDEIHGDIVYGENVHHPLLSLKEEYSKGVIQLCAPSKTFNIAGLKFSMVIIKDETMKAAFNKTQIAMSLDIKNTFGIEGTIAAYSAQGEEWLEQELEYMQGNIDLVEEFIKNEMPGVTMAKPEGTFLCWLDLSKLGLSDGEIVKRIVIHAGVICVPGPWFGKGGEQHVRLNIGCTRRNLKLALERIKQALYETK